MRDSEGGRSSFARKPVDWALRPFADVRPGEGATALLMTANLFVVLVAYYVIKTVREPLILTTGGAELKAYAAAAQAGLLLAAVPVYSFFAARTSTRKLVFGLTLFFVFCIEAFFFGWSMQLPMLGFAFYVWVGIFNVAIIAQFWSFANDVYSVPRGERLFPLIAIGATVGAPVGAWIAKQLFDSGLSPAALMQVAAMLLLLHVFLYRATLARPDGLPQGDWMRERERQPIFGGFVLVLRNRYLTEIGVLLVVLNLVNSTGEYLLSRYAEAQADAALSAALQLNAELEVGPFMDQFFGSFYGDFFFWVNVASLLIQALLVSRLVKYTGIAGLLFALPLIALGTYGLVAAGFGFALFRGFKTAENATDYSAMNTARAMLWLPTSHHEKFQAKQAVDTFFVRFGDVLAALFVYLGTEFWALSPLGFARTNVLFIGLWFLVAAWVYQRYRNQTAS